MENFSIPETMKAMTLVAYDKLQLATVPVPKPGPGEVLCRIKSVAICGSDPKMIHGDYAWTNWPPYYPFIMGTSGPVRSLPWARASTTSRSATALPVRPTLAAASATTARRATTLSA